jgi:hypothetical protein
MNEFDEILALHHKSSCEHNINVACVVQVNAEDYPQRKLHDWNIVYVIQASHNFPTSTREALGALKTGRISPPWEFCHSPPGNCADSHLTARPGAVIASLSICRPHLKELFIGG